MENMRDSVTDKNHSHFGLRSGRERCFAYATKKEIFFFLFLTTVVKRSYCPHQPHRYARRPSGPTRFNKSPASGPEELSDTVSGSVDAPAGF